jgi:hypothetical protein
MFIRNSKGEIVFFDTTKFKNDKDKYGALWKEMYDIKLKENINDTKNKILNYVKNSKNMNYL